MDLIIVRHGETAWTLSGQHTGSTELDLTPRGREEAASIRELLERLVAGRQPVVMSSPRRRALETASLALPSRPAVESELLVELGYGDYEGLTSAEITERRPGWDLWRDGCPGGEPLADAGERAATLLAEVVDPSSDPVVVVTHGHFSRILTAVALGLDPARGGLFSSDTASVSVLDDRQGVRSVALWNVTGQALGRLELLS